MSTDAVAIWPLLKSLEARARHLEDEAAALRAEVRQAIRSLDRAVATYNVDGEEYVITAGDVAAVRERLVRPYSDEALCELALADRIAERSKDMPKPELRRRLRQNIEAIRAEAVARGVAIDDSLEAVVGD